MEVRWSGGGACGGERLMVIMIRWNGDTGEGGKGYWYRKGGEEKYTVQ